MTKEIKFECMSCRQRILVDSHAAGMDTDCPTCGSSVTIPKTTGLNDRHYAAPKRSREKRRSSSAAPRDTITVRENDTDFEVPEHFEVPELTALRQNILEAGVETTRLERELSDAQEQLAAARAEAAKFRQQFEAAAAEAEKLQANAHHNQAELKTFQTERLALKNELSQLRQKLSATDERFEAANLELIDAQARLGEQEIELGQLQRATVALEAERTQLYADREDLHNSVSQLSSDLSATRSSEGSLTSHMRALEVEFGAARELLNEAQSERTIALREIQALSEGRAELLLQLEDAQARLAGLAQTEAKLTSAEQTLAEAKESEISLRSNLAKAGAEIGELRNTVSANRAGVELIEARDQLEATETERKALLAEAAQLRATLSEQEGAARLSEEQIKVFGHQLGEARRAAEATSDVRLRRDNEVLRGIVARQNGDLEQKHSQLVRLKRARLALKIVYSIFILGLIAVGVLAVKFVPALGF